jgi:hypothetical protein
MEDPLSIGNGVGIDSSWQKIYNEEKEKKENKYALGIFWRGTYGLFGVGRGANRGTLLSFALLQPEGADRCVGNFVLFRHCRGDL